MTIIFSYDSLLFLGKFNIRPNYETVVVNVLLKSHIVQEQISYKKHYDSRASSCLKKVIKPRFSESATKFEKNHPLRFDTLGIY